MDVKQHATMKPVSQWNQRSQKNPWDKCGWKHSALKYIVKSSCKKEINRNMSLPQEIRKVWNKQPNLPYIPLRCQRRRACPHLLMRTSKLQIATAEASIGEFWNPTSRGKEEAATRWWKGFNGV